LIDAIRRWWGKFWNWSLKNTEKTLGISVAFVFFVWATIGGYLVFSKAVGHTGEFPLEKLGQVGDFFNVATSLASLMTVVLVYRAYHLQKNELKQVKQQLEKQITAAKNEERINRAIKLFEEYLTIFNNIDDKDGVYIADRYEEMLDFIQRIIGMRKSRFNEYIDFDVLGENLTIQGLTKRMRGVVLSLEKQAELKEADIKRSNEEHNRLSKPKKLDGLNSKFDNMEQIGDLKASIENTKKQMLKIRRDRKAIKSLVDQFQEHFPEPSG